MPRMDDDIQVDASREPVHFTQATLVYAGPYLHEHDSPVHTHSFVEIAFVASGAGIHHSLAGRHDLHTGDVVLLRPGVWHGYENCGPLEVYNCCFSSELLRRELAWAREDPLLGYLLWTALYSAPGRGVLTASLDPSALDECMTHLRALAVLGHQPISQHRADIAGRLSLLLGHLGRAVASTHGVLPHEGAATHPAVGRMLRMLESDVARRWTLAELAAETHLTPGHLVRVFKATTGLPPMAYIAQLRAEHAAVLLLHSDESVAAIGRAVGWPDQNYFARRFRAYYGLSATTYRKRFATGAAHLHPTVATSGPLGEAAS